MIVRLLACGRRACWACACGGAGRAGLLRAAARSSRPIPSTIMPRAWSRLKDGSLLAAWYAGSGERTADDVVIEGAWLAQGENGVGPQVPDGRHARLSGLQPGALRRARRIALAVLADDPRPPLGRGAAQVRPLRAALGRAGRLEMVADRASCTSRPKTSPPRCEQAIAALSDEEKSKYRTDLEEAEDAGCATSSISGWAGCRGCIRSCFRPGAGSCRFIPTRFRRSIMAISDDRGETWTASRPLIGFGNIQPSLVRKNDGELVAFMRDNGPHHQIRLSTSRDDGVSWSPVVDSPFPNPGAGIEAIRLANGHWALIYNDLPRGTALAGGLALRR